MPEIHISYHSAVRYNCVNKIIELWVERTRASKEAQRHAIKMWEQGYFDLIIYREDFFKLIKELNEVVTP